MDVLKKSNSSRSLLAERWNLIRGSFVSSLCVMGGLNGSGERVGNIFMLIRMEDSGVELIE